MVLAYAGGFVLLAVWTWTGDPGWALAGVLLGLAFLVAVARTTLVAVVARRSGAGGARERAAGHRFAEPVVALVALVAFVALDAGAALLVLGLGLGSTAWLRSVRNPGPPRGVPPAQGAAER